MAELTTRQKKAIAALLSEVNMTKAAKAARVSFRSLESWMKLPEFREALTAAESDMITTAARRLYMGSMTALQVIHDVMIDPTAPPGARRQAANDWLSFSLKYREAASLETRLAELEKVVNNG